VGTSPAASTNVIPAPRVPEGHERDKAGTHAHPSLLSRRIMRHHTSMLLRRMIIMADREKTPAVNILASKRNGTIYTGVTSDLYIRMPQHKQGLIEGFTKKYHVHMLVYYEMHHLMTEAMRREHRIKEWRRQWKIRNQRQASIVGWVERSETQHSRAHGLCWVSLALDPTYAPAPPVPKKADWQIVRRRRPRCRSREPDALGLGQPCSCAPTKVYPTAS
jgi:putative endonuclease